MEGVRKRKQGILLQGALFDGQLRSTLVSSPPVTNAPQLTLGWTQIGSPTIYKEQESITVPLYTDASRTEHVATVQMPCTEVHKWNIAAVALFLR
ncbi:hypothetical protein ANCCAN_15423 [Ancylostoma caninum]|uniref:Dynein heavy chain C-terminal domain-containing protein n=1 Tax=Ancylostoma caninum TaxID=29170 RepID=A0A368G2K7_ANCCA|nr:hypothetical protein ANCCAN_15423 [Ancylostoma caninum]